ncbi:MAG: MarR family transcriptional regulator [Deltaproteobacteria bacterium]|nr:MarR family transcriptional regulator [Deltaproteobacteria bacterium]
MKNRSVNGFDINERLSYLLTRVVRASINRLQKRFTLTGQDVTVEQWMLLVLLWMRDGQHQQQLADTLGKDRTTVTRLIDGLERQSLLVRIPDTSNRRQKRICLTRTGRELEHALMSLEYENTMRQEDGISPEDLDTCKRVLKKVFDNLSVG